VEFLKPNVDLINDISKFIHGDEEAGKVLQGINDFSDSEKGKLCHQSLLELLKRD